MRPVLTLRRRLLILLCLLGCCARPGPVLADNPPTGLTCKAYLIYDVAADSIVTVYNPQQKQPIASLTKLMTAVIACQRLRFDGRYILTPEEQLTFKTETMRADKMLELMLVASHNGCCKLVSRLVAGDEDTFVNEMNAQAQKLGLSNTHFINSSGLPGAGQYSTLYDLLRLTRIAVSYPRIRAAMLHEPIQLGDAQLKPTLADLYKRHPGLLGGKTGYTKAAGRCLVLLYRGAPGSQRAGRDHIVITLGSKGVKDSFRDAELLLRNYGLYTGEVGQWQ